MKKKKAVSKSLRYAKILFKVEDGINYNQELSEELNIKPNALIEHLKFLEGKNFLKSERAKKYNKKIYSINYKKVVEKFVDFIVENYQNQYKDYMKTEGNRQKKTIKIIEKKQPKAFMKQKNKLYVHKVGELYNYSKDKKFLKSIKNNRYLKIIFREIFNWNARYKIDKTLKEIFQDLRSLMEGGEILEGIPHASPKFDNVTKKEVEEYLKTINKEIKNDKQYKELKIFSNIMSGVTPFIELQGWRHFQIYLILLKGLKEIPNNEALKNFAEHQEGLIKEILKDYPELKKKIKPKKLKQKTLTLEGDINNLDKLKEKKEKSNYVFEKTREITIDMQVKGSYKNMKEIEKDVNKAMKGTKPLFDFETENPVFINLVVKPLAKKSKFKFVYSTELTAKNKLQSKYRNYKIKELKKTKQEIMQKIPA